jgi:hypothetical protein
MGQAQADLRGLTWHPEALYFARFQLGTSTIHQCDPDNCDTTELTFVPQLGPVEGLARITGGPVQGFHFVASTAGGLLQGVNEQQQGPTELFLGSQEDVLGVVERGGRVYFSTRQGVRYCTLAQTCQDVEFLDSNQDAGELAIEPGSLFLGNTANGGPRILRYAVP